MLGGIERWQVWPSSSWLRICVALFVHDETVREVDGEESQPYRWLLFHARRRDSAYSCAFCCNFWVYLD